MQKFFTMLITAVMLITAGMAEAQSKDLQPQRGVIRVKLQPEMAHKVGKAPRLKSLSNLSTGITPLDAATRSIKTVSIQRLIPYAPQFEAERAKYGLDRWYEIRFDETVDAQEARRILSRTAGIEKAENIVPMERKEGNGPARVAAAPAVAGESVSGFNDPRLAAQWHYYNDGSVPGSVAGADINLFEAWKVTTGNPDVIVAVIDGGIDVTHEDLSQNIAVNLAELNGTPGVDDDGNGYVDDIYGFNFVTNAGEISPHNHGTHVAGTVAAVNNNGIGVAGVAGGNGSPSSGVRMISCQVFDSRSGTNEGDFAKAIVYAAERGASIAQCSWGWGEAGYCEQAVLDAIDYFTSSSQPLRKNMLGGLCIFATGNDGMEDDFYPACYPAVLSVAAMTCDYTPASYSNRGTWVDVIAPGGLLTYAENQGVLSTLPDNRYGYLEGTSMATPHVSGIAALVLSKYGSPTFSADILRTQLTTSVRDFYSVAGNETYSGLFGSGYVDAYRALLMGDGEAPAAVTDLAAFPAQDNVTLRWTIPASSDNNVHHHIVYYSDKPFTADTPAASLKSVEVDTKFQLSGESIEYVLENLSAETTYHIAIVAVNRWGNASAMSEVVSTTTNSGPSMSVDAYGLDLSATADAPIASTSFTISNNSDGLLRWSGYKRQVSMMLSSVARPMPGSVVPYSGNLSVNPQAAATRYVSTEDFSQDDYPQEIFYYDTFYATIGDMDRSLPNSLAQWYHVDPSVYPDGFNLTHIIAEGAHGINPTIQIYRGDAAISSASKILDFQPDFFYYGGNISLPEQLYFAPGESFWIALHFPAPADELELYPLGIGTTDTGDVSNFCYMSNDLGKSWSRLTEALKGSRYESIASTISWAVKARSLNPDCSEVLVLNPSSGTVEPNATQQVTLSNDGSRMVNGNYSFKLRFTTNETTPNDITIPVSLTVSGNKPDVQGPKIVDFGSLLVGEKKTLSIELYNRGYGSFRGSQWGAGLYDNNISSNSEHFAGPDYVQAGFPARSSTTIEVSYAPLSAGSHTGIITFTDVEGNTCKLTVRGVATEPAKITVDPTSVDAGTLDIDAVPATASFSVKNDGSYPLEFVFPRFSDTAIDGMSGSVHKFGYTIATNINGATGAEYDGNPDLIGATDITSKFNDDVFVSEPIDLGFSFPFYGKNYDKVYITSYGAICFNKPEQDFRMPFDHTQSYLSGLGMISAYGWKLPIGPASKIEYAKVDGKFVVKYTDVMGLVYDQDYTPVSFRLTLDSNGDIEIFYDNYEPMTLFQEGSTLFAGLIDPDAADAQIYTSADMADFYGTAQPTEENSRFRNIYSGSAIRFTAPKPYFVKAVSPAYALLSPGESIEIEATLKADASMYAGATYNDIAIMSNDPLLPVTFVHFEAVITGESLKPEVSVGDTDIDFGRVFRTSVLDIPVTVKNSGHDSMTIQSAALASGKYTIATQLPVVVEAGRSKDIIVSVPTTEECDLSDVLTVVTSAGDVSVTIHGTVIGVPTIDLSYEEINATVASGETVAAPLTVTNNGNEPLKFSVIPNQLVSFPVSLSDNSKMSYRYSSSIDDDNVKYEWIDITSDADAVHHDLIYYMDHDFVAVDLPFDFPFYGKTYNKIYICNTGFVTFNEYQDNRIWPEPPGDFPRGSVYSNLIAPYWGLHSISETPTGGTYYRISDDQAVISFMEYGNSVNIGVCFQLIMNADGTFKFQYKALDQNAVIFNLFGISGIISDDYTDSIKLPERFVVFDKAVQFNPVVENTLQPGTSSVIDIEVLGNHMAGHYDGSLAIMSNVPSREDIGIPVSVTVTGEAAPVFPEDITVEHTIGYTSTDYNNPLVQMGAMYDAPFEVSNNGTAAFTITGIKNDGPSIYDDWFDEYISLFNLMYEGVDAWSGQKGWMMYNGFEPIIVANEPVKFSIPMFDYEFANTVGSYVIPLTFYYVEGDDYDNVKQHTVTVTFNVTPAPVVTLDREEIAITGVNDEYTATESVSISNEGDYRLTYELRLDPTGQGEAIEGPDDGGGIAPLSGTRRTNASQQNLEVLKSVSGEMIRPLETGHSDNAMDTPADVEFTNALYYPAMTGSNAWFYGSGSANIEYKAAVHFVAPEGGINISHIYTAVNTELVPDPVIKVTLVKGDYPDGDAILGRGSIALDTQSSATARYMLIPLNKAVYLSEGEDFCVVMTFPAGVIRPTVLVRKAEENQTLRYMGFVEEIGWFDVAEFLSDQQTNLGYICSCIETKPGDPWIKMTAPAETVGSIEPGENVKVDFKLTAVSAPLEKGNKAMLVIKSNDPFQPIVNFPITIDKNGVPVLQGPASTVYAKEGETTVTTVTISDPDGDDMQFRLDDPFEMASVKEVIPSATDSNVSISYNADTDIHTILGATEPVAIAVAIAPDYGKAGSNYAFTVTAVDRNVQEVEISVPYVVEHVNRAPEAVTGEIEIEISRGGMSDVISFADMFTDPDDDELSFVLSYAATPKATSAYTTPAGVIFYGETTGKEEAIVTATDTSGATAQCRLKITVKEPSGIDEAIAGDGSVTVMPNPVVADINAVCGFSAHEATFSIFDGTGRSIYTSVIPVEQGQPCVIPFASAPAGFYFLKVTAPGINATAIILKK